jgi:recombination protein RecT
MTENKLQLYIRSGAVQGSIEQTLKDRADDFTTSLLTVINGNPVLQECDAQDVVRTALKAASMRLPIDPNLGLAYIIPYRNKKKVKVETQRPDGTAVQVWQDQYVYEPQLQIGWKGFVQLALRTRLYKTMNVTDVREGEYVGIDRLTGAIDFAWEPDTDKRNKLSVTGYVAYFRLHDGFEKILYMSVEELEKHARQYSQSYRNGNGKWKDDKPNMSRKTVVKLLISKWGPQSTEIQKALRADQAAMSDEDGYNYLDNQKGGASPSQDSDTANASVPNADASGPVEGEVVDPPAPDGSDQTPKQPGEAQIPQEHPADELQDPPQPSVKQRAAQWAAKGKAANAKKKVRNEGSSKRDTKKANAQTA